MSSTSSTTDARRSSNPGPYLIVIENVRVATSLSVRRLIEFPASAAVYLARPEGPRSERSIAWDMDGDGALSQREVRRERSCTQEHLDFVHYRLGYSLTR